MRKVIEYLKGLVMTYAVFLGAAAIGWILIGAPIASARLVVPLIMAFAAWTAMYFLSKVVWAILLIVGSCLMGIGFLFGLGVLGYLAVELGIYVLPGGWAIFTGDDVARFIIGAFIALIDLIVETDVRKRVYETLSPVEKVRKESVK